MEPQPFVTTEEWEKRLGTDARRLRIQLRLTQAELANNANISLSSVQNLERGGGSSLSTLIRVVRALGRTDWLELLAPDEPKISPVKLLREREKQAAIVHSRVRHSVTSQ